MENNKPKKKSKNTILKVFLSLFCIAIFAFVLHVISFFVPPMARKISFSEYSFNAIYMFLRPAEAMWNRSHYYYDFKSDNYWDGYSSTALFWLKLSAVIGGAPSQAEYSGYCFFKKKDIKTAIYWMEKAAKQTNEDNKYDDYKGRLALLYCQEGECKNEEKALALYKESAALGNEKSAQMYVLLFRSLYPGKTPEEVLNK